MNRKIFIIHSSEIIRKGLSTILRNYFNIEIIQLERMEELKAFHETNDQNLIFIIEGKTALIPQAVNPFKKNNQLKIITFTNHHPDEANDARLCDFSIHAETPGIQIQEMISKCWKIKKFLAKPTDSEELTPRERDVLRLVAQGFSNKVIAEKLFISIHTVISHRKNITEKTGIKSISGLTVYAILNNLIDTDSINPEDLF